MLENIFYGTGFGRERMSPARAAYLFVAWALVPGFLVAMFYQMLVGLVFTGVLASVGQNYNLDIRFRHPFLTWTGDVGLEDLTIRPNDPSAEGPGLTTIRRIRFDLPNLGVMQQALATAGGDESESKLLRVVDKLDHIGVHVEGMKADGFDSLPGILDHIGPASAAPLDAEGCVGDVTWMPSELPKLGIENDGIDLHLTLSNVPDAHEVHLDGELVSPHSSRAVFSQHFAAPSMSAFLDDEGAHVANYERIAISDEGFVAARDAYCAKRDGVAPEEFRERHLAAVRRLMQVHGMRPTEELETVYRQYLEHGQLVLEAHPNPHVKREDYHHYAVADQAKMYNATLAANGKPVPVDVVEVPSRDIPLSFEGSTWDLVAAESRAATAPAADGNDVGAAAAPAAVASATPPPATAPKPAAPVAPAPAAAAAAPALAQARAVQAPAVAKPAVQVGDLPAWAIPPKTTRTTVDGKPLASSLPPKSSGKRVPFQHLAFGDLAPHIGDRIQVTTIYGERIDGRVEGVSGSLLRLRSSPAMGYAITNFESAKVRSIISME